MQIDRELDFFDVRGDRPPDAEGWDAWNKREFQSALRRKGLPTSVDKSELIERLKTYQTSIAGHEHDPPPKR